ncbi:MAG: ribosomal-processing cysteine protease Prp [Candidatus Eremiobacteraeota bacterium]|nr:ribosomal-processing cysteine protease Prp [Candidatus Eremiobacteraeota bacterium]
MHELRISGHAGFAQRGNDIVCAAVSALAFAAAFGLKRHCGASVELIDRPAEDFVLRSRGGGAPAAAVLETALSGLRAIARSYPGYVKVTTTQRAATAKEQP